MTGDAATTGDDRFAGAIPAVYERLLVPMIFEEPAGRLAATVAAHDPKDILETAAGTGALTRELLRRCPAAAIIATDLNQPMLDTAAARTTANARLTWRQADAVDLPFDDAAFDVVACQFGAMFFPDRVRGYREAARVLRPGGRFAFTVWDDIRSNQLAFVIESALVAAVPGDALAFMSRLPHGYGSAERIRSDLEQAGFPDPDISLVDGIARTTAEDAAVAFCQGTPLRSAIEQQGSLTLPEATALAEDALTRRFGAGGFEAPTRYFEIVAAPAD